MKFEKGDNRRVQKVARELTHLVAEYFLTGLKQKTQCLASVTHALVSPDFRHARVYISLLGEPEDQNNDWKILSQQFSAVQKYVSKNLRIKFVPSIEFFLDDTFSEAEKIDRILEQVKKVQLPSDVQSQ